MDSGQSEEELNQKQNIWRDTKYTSHGSKSVGSAIRYEYNIRMYVRRQYIMRSENSLEKSMILGMGGGPRKRGGPRARWVDDIKAVTNCTLTELCGLTRDRDAWRKMVIGITKSASTERERETSLFATRWVGFKHLQYIQYKYNKIPTIW